MEWCHSTTVPLACGAELADHAALGQPEVMGDGCQVAAAAGVDVVRPGARRLPRRLTLGLFQRDPIHLTRLVDGRSHLAGRAQQRFAEPPPQPGLHPHVQHPAGKAELHQPPARGPGGHDVEPAIAVVAVTVAHAQDAGLQAEIQQLGGQRGARHGRVFRQALFGVVELVGAVDQLDRAVEMRREVVLNADADVAAAQEGSVVAGHARLDVTALQELVLRQAGQPGIVLAGQARVVQQAGGAGGVGDLDAGHVMLRLGEVHRVVVDEQDSGRAQLHGVDQASEPRSLRTPVDAGEDEVVPDALTLQLGAHRRRIVLRADGADDAAPREAHHHVVQVATVVDAAFAKRAVPEGVVEVQTTRRTGCVSSCINRRSPWAATGLKTDPKKRSKRLLFEKKRQKALRALSPTIETRRVTTAYPAETRVFWFFFSKKNRLLLRRNRCNCSAIAAFTRPRCKVTP